MKKIFLFVVCLFMLVGCSRKINYNDIVKSLGNRISKIDGYIINGNLSVSNNDDVYNYDVTVNYKKKDQYKVIIKNVLNGFTQIILKNDTGVYV